MSIRSEGSKLASMATAVVVITFLGKLLGVVREAYIASAYGASYVADIYVLQNGIVNAICTILLCVVTTAFIPLTLDARREGRGGAFVSNVFIGLTIFAVGMAVVLIFVPELLLAFIAPGILEKYSGKTLQIILWSLQISMIDIVMLMIQGLLRALLQLNERMQVASAQGIILNIILIGYLVFFSDQGLIGLSVSMVVAQTIVVVFFFIYATRKKMLNLTFSSVLDVLKDCKSMIRLALPVLLMSLLSQASYLVDRTVASRFDEGTMALIGYATTIGIAINGVFGESINNVIYPKISELAAGGNHEELSNFGIYTVLFASIPLVATIGGVIPASVSAINLIYGHGSFRGEYVTTSALFLSLYLPGMLFFYERDFLNRFCFALKQTKLPSVCAGVGFVLTIMLNLTIPSVMGAKGIVIATATASLVTFLLELGLMIYFGYLAQSKLWLKSYMSIVFSFAISTALAKFFINWLGFTNDFLILAFSVFCAGFFYSICLVTLNLNTFMKFAKGRR